MSYDPSGAIFAFTDKSEGEVVSVAIRRWGGPASLIAGGLWLVVWFHQQSAHGKTEVNEMRVVWGLTWMDTSKILVVSMLLLMVGLGSLYLLRGKPGRLGVAGSRLTFFSLGLLILATLLEFAVFPWGSYEITFEEATGLAASNTSGALQGGVSLLFTVALVVFTTDLVRAKVISIWVAIALVGGGLATVYLSPVFPLPGISWLVLAFVVWPRRRKAVATA